MALCQHGLGSVAPISALQLQAAAEQGEEPASVSAAAAKASATPCVGQDDAHTKSTRLFPSIVSDIPPF